MEIEFYETASRNQPITEFIKSLKPAEQAKIARALDLLEEFGTEWEDLTSRSSPVLAVSGNCGSHLGDRRSGWCF